MDNNFNQGYSNQQNYGYSQPNNNCVNNNTQGYEIPNNNVNMYSQYDMNNQEPKKKKTMVIVLIILLLLGLCCGGSLVAAIVTGNASFSIGTSTSSNNDILEELKELEDKDKDKDKDKDEDEDEDKPRKKNGLKEHSDELPIITIDGDELTFGNTLGELEDMGYDIIIDEYTNFELDNEITDDYFYEPVNLETPKGNIIKVWIENLGDNPTTPRECYVVSYCVEYDDYDNDYQATAVLDNGVELMETTLEDFKEAYPNPTSEYVDEEYDYASYMYEVEIDEDTSIEYSYSFYEGLLVDIEIFGYFY